MRLRGKTKKERSFGNSAIPCQEDGNHCVEGGTCTNSLPWWTLNISRELFPHLASSFLCLFFKSELWYHERHWHKLPGVVSSSITVQITILMDFMSSHISLHTKQAKVPRTVIQTSYLMKWRGKPPHSVIISLNLKHKTLHFQAKSFFFNVSSVALLLLVNKNFLLKNNY